MMSDLSLFYSSMSSVLNQWSDFQTARPLYKHYFAMQKANASEKASEAADKFEKKDTKKSTAYSAAKNDKLGTYADNVTSSASKLEAAFKADSKTGEVDMDKAFEAAQSFVDSYNQLYSATRGSGNSTVSGKSEFIANMTTAYSGKLSKVGISIGSDGKLSVDKDTFKSASEDELDAVFGKKNSYASFMSTQASAVSAFAKSAAYLEQDKTYAKTSATTAAATQTASMNGYLYNKLF